MVFKAQDSSAAAGLGSEGRRRGGGQSDSTQRCHKLSLIVLRSWQRAAERKSDPICFLTQVSVAKSCSRQPTKQQRVSDKPTIQPCGLGDRSYTPDFESWRAPSEKLRKADKTLGIRGFSPDQMSDSLSQVEFPKWTKSGRRFFEFIVR